MSLHLSTPFQSTNAAREVYAIQVAEIRFGVDRAAQAKAFSDALARAQIWMCDPRGENTVVVIVCSKRKLYNCPDIGHLGAIMHYAHVQV